MANLTIVVDEEVLRRARVRAVQQGTSVNAVLREYINAYAGQDTAAAALTAFLELADEAGGRSTDARRWTREELYDRPVLRRG